jgi:protein-disulfide isomerase-like protein with CxxC motif
VPKGAAPDSSTPPGGSVEQRPGHLSVFGRLPDLGRTVMLYGVPATALIVAAGYIYKNKAKAKTASAASSGVSKSSGVEGRRTQRNVEMAKLGAKVGANYAEAAAKKTTNAK